MIDIGAKLLQTAIVYQAVKDLRMCLLYNVNNADCNIHELRDFLESEYADWLLAESGSEMNGRQLFEKVVSICQKQKPR